MEKLIAVDPGKFEIKSARSGDSIRTESFRSKLYSLKKNEHFEPQGNSIFITYKGDQYIIGDQGAESDRNFTKDTILHKIGLMASLSKFVKGGDVVRLVLGCPAATYKDKEARDLYRSYMTDNGILSFETDKNKYDITIISTLVLPEASGAPYVYPQLFKGKRVAVIDIGGLNMNFSIFNDLVIDLDSMHTINHGGYMIEDRVKSLFSSKYGVSLSQADFEQVVKNGGLKRNGEIIPESHTLLMSIYEQFVKEIPNKIKEFDYDISLMDVLFVGGTSDLLRNEIAKVIPYATVADFSSSVNVSGFLKVGELKYGGR